MVFPEGTVRSWSVGVSDMANNTFNPIRNIVDTMTLIANKEKDMISLSIGDPTLFGNLGPPKNAVDATAKSLCSGTTLSWLLSPELLAPLFHLFPSSVLPLGQMNGYGPSAGLASARAAVAEHVSRNPGVDIQPADVILVIDQRKMPTDRQMLYSYIYTDNVSFFQCSGCSSALDLCISAIANPGDAILVPRPGNQSDDTRGVSILWTHFLHLIRRISALLHPGERARDRHQRIQPPARPWLGSGPRPFGLSHWRQDESRRRE